MLSALLKRSTLTAQKVLLWAGPPQRCRLSSLARAPDGGLCSPRVCWASSGVAICAKTSPPALTRLLKQSEVNAAAAAATSLSIRTQHFHTSAQRAKKRPVPEPPPRELDLLRYDMKDLWKSPKPALYLGAAGLIPFVSPALLMAMMESYIPELAYAQVAYGAAIVSFLGGARWGFALPESSPAKPDWLNLANSVVPSLLAWVAMLMADSVVPAATMVVMGLGVSLHYDLSLLPTYPSWFKALRSILSLVAFFSLVGTLIVHGVYPEKKIFPDM